MSLLKYGTRDEGMLHWHPELYLSDSHRICARTAYVFCSHVRKRSGDARGENVGWSLGATVDWPTGKKSTSEQDLQPIPQPTLSSRITCMKRDNR